LRGQNWAQHILALLTFQIGRTPSTRPVSRTEPFSLLSIHRKAQLLTNEQVGYGYKLKCEVTLADAWDLKPWCGYYPR